MAKILIIEGDQLMRDSLQEFLHYEGFETLTVADGRSVGQLVKEYCPDLILSVIDMPEKNGYEILAELRQDPLTASIPCIFLTSRAAKEDWQKAIKSGIDAYLIKPCGIAALLSTMYCLLTQNTTDKEKSRKYFTKNHRGHISHLYQP